MPWEVVGGDMLYKPVFLTVETTSTLRVLTISQAHTPRLSRVFGPVEGRFYFFREFRVKYRIGYSISKRQKQAYMQYNDGVC